MHRSYSNDRTLASFIDEEITNQLPRRSLDTMLSKRRLSHKNIPSRKSLSRIPPRLDSTWSFSPRTSSNPPIIDHCISSLHQEGNIHSITVSKGLVLTGSSQACIRAYQPLTLSESGYIQTGSGAVRAMLAHNDLLFTSHKDNRIRVWNVESPLTKFTPKKITNLPKQNPLSIFTAKLRTQPHKDIISCMAFNHAEGILYTGSWDKTVKAWRLSDRKCIDSFVAHSDNINSMAINRDGFIFTCSSDGSVKMWSQVYGENFHTLTMTLSCLPFPIYALALLEKPKSRSSILYSGSSDGCLNFWVRGCSGGYSHMKSMHAHRFAVLCLTVFGNMVISGSADSTVKIWKRGACGTHHCLAILEGHGGPVKCLATCIEDKSIEKSFLVFSASLDHTLKVWRVDLLPEMVKTRSSLGDSSLMKIEVESESKSKSGPVLSPSWVRKVQHARLSISG